MSEQKPKIHKFIQFLLLFLIPNVQTFGLKIIIVIGVGLAHAINVNNGVLIGVLIMLSAATLSFVFGILLYGLIDLPILLTAIVYCFVLHLPMLYASILSKNFNFLLILAQIATLLISIMLVRFGILYAQKVRSKEPDGGELKLVIPEAVVITGLILFWFLILIIFKLLEMVFSAQTVPI